MSLSGHSASAWVMASRSGAERRIRQNTLFGSGKLLAEITLELDTVDLPGLVYRRHFVPVHAGSETHLIAVVHVVTKALVYCLADLARRCWFYLYNGAW